jgi:hypothetical protein
MANVPIRQMFAVCGMTNGPVIRIPGQPAINPAAKFVESLGIDDPVQLLNFTVDDVLDMVKAHNRESRKASPCEMGKFMKWATMKHRETRKVGTKFL